MKKSLVLGSLLALGIAAPATAHRNAGTESSLFDSTKWNSQSVWVLP